MSSFCTTAFLFLFSATLCQSSLAYNGQPKEDGFTFDFPEDLDIELLQDGKQELYKSHYEAVVGKVFHLAPQGLERAKGPQGFIAKQENSKGLPHWLVFNKKTGTFWGVPLPGDEGNIHIKVSIKGKQTFLDSIDIRVVKEHEEDSTTTEKCKSNEDNTVLTLLLDKNLKTIKPKQRVIAVNNIAKYFRLPHSAFTLKPQVEQDDITDSSVVLAGPGNIHLRTSKISSLMEILVGCDGRLWESTAPLIHNLKQEARDGTIAEVLRLPLIGWRVKTETKPVIRNKRQTNVEDYGSGDYDDDYYDDYEEEYNENDDENLGGVEGHTPIVKKPAKLPTYPTTLKGTTPSTTTTTTTTTESSSTHPHRHHHGQSPLDEENELVIGETVPGVPQEITTPKTTTTESQRSKDSGPTKINIPKPADALNEYDGDYDYDAYDEESGDDIESATIVPGAVNKVFGPVTEVNVPTTERIPETDDDFEVEPEIETTPVKMPSTTTTIPTTSTTISTTSTTTSTTTEASTQQFDFAEDTEQPAATIINEIMPEIPTEQSTTTVTTGTSELITATGTASTSTTTFSTTSTTTTEASTTIVEETIPEIVPTIPSSSTSTTTTENPTTETELFLSTRHVSSSTTEETLVTKVIAPVNKFIPVEPKNTKPYIENRLQYQVVTAGKVFRYVIPKNTFKDAEDGYNLTLRVLDINEQPISKGSWLQFNPLRRELYGLPLANDVSNWMYIIRASDKEGEYKQDQLTIQVQQHRLERVVNHEFILNLRIEKPHEYPHYIDWSLRVLRALGRVYGTNMSEITVRHINHTSDPVVFAWSNDSLPTTYCPRSEIEELYKVLTANDRGDPSREMSLILSPDIRIKKIANRDLTICEQQPTIPVTPSENFSPILRNPVDKINATVGELLIYKVKDDTFYDPEDVDPSALNITLLTSDLGPIPSTDWLQFDNKNREFYGIPRKPGITEYFLLCVDTGGRSAKDSLEVVVNLAPKKPYNVEFGMTIGVPVETFSNSAGMQRKFVEKLMEIFDEPNQYNFHFLPFKSKRESNFESTGVYWFNKSLPVDYCPNDEIKQLEQLLHSDSRSISSRVHRIMAPEFTVSTIKVHHVGNCKPKLVVPTPEMPIIPEATQPPQAQETDVMFTLILPIIIIAIMLFIASVAACILYRKRKQGKMNVEEDGRNGSYGNKGIPVIFQEELEEKPDPGTKAPVILKDEKPPLAPPEYSKSGSVKLEDSEPYQPPPPFTRTQENGRQPRPKPTPTYRKPPPYVPP